MNCSHCSNCIDTSDKFGNLTYDGLLLCCDCLPNHLNKPNWYCYILRSKSNKYKNS